MPGSREVTLSSRPAASDRMRAEVVRGLGHRPPELSPKWFYDRRGSELFEAITRLPEYYPTRSEQALLERHLPGWIADWKPRALVELGAGAAEKTRVLLDAMEAAAPGATYVPVDISAAFLRDTADRLSADYPDLTVRPAVGDMTRDVPVPPDLPRPALFALLGGTIGNFRRHAAVELVARTAARMEPGDRFLLGADLHKDTAVLEAAYNDDQGVTAAFNLNVLHVLNRELGADFDPDAFRHHAFYDTEKRRIEMHLVARRDMTVTVPDGGRFELQAGDSIRTEISCKYDRAAIEALLGDAGLVLDRWVAGPDDVFRFGLAVARRG